MRIAINCGYNAIQKNLYTGFGVFIKAFLDTLIKIDRQNIYFLLSFDKIIGLDALPDNFHLCLAPSLSKRSHQNVLYWERRFLSAAEYHDLEVDLVYQPFFSNLKETRGHHLVTTIHDIIPVIFHQWRYIFTGKTRLKQFSLDGFLSKWLYPMRIKKNTHIITLSESSKEDIIQFLHYPESRISTIPNGSDHLKNNADQALSNEDHDLLSALPSLDQPYILYHGGHTIRKNVDLLYKAFEILHQRIKNPPALIVVGTGYFVTKGKRKYRQSQLPIYFPGRVSFGLLNHLIKHCTMTVYPTLYEGYGFPVLEALENEVPCVVSDTSSLRDFASEAVVYADPYSAESFAKGMLKILHEKDSYKDKATQAKSHFEHLTWVHCVNTYITLWKSLCT